MHQYRAAYDLCGTEYADFDHREEDTAVRERIRTLDREMLGECAAVYTISRTASDRLTRFNGVPSQPLYHPSPLAPKLRSGPYGDYSFRSAGSRPSSASSWPSRPWRTCRPPPAS